MISLVWLIVVGGNIKLKVMLIEFVIGIESVSSYYVIGVYIYYYCIGNCFRVDIWVVCWFWGLIILGLGREMIWFIYIVVIDLFVWVFVFGF